MALTRENLTKYFGGSDAPALGSNFGGMCEIVLDVSHASVECRACEGLGFRSLESKDLSERYRKIAAEKDDLKARQLRKDLSYQSECPVCRGSGYTTMRRADIATAMHPMFTTVRCGKCRGCGETFPPNDVTAERQDVCLGCLGEAYVVPVTVKEKGSSKHGKPPQFEVGESGDDYTAGSEATASWVNEDALMQRGQTARELDALRRADPLLGAAMAAFFGLEGDKWGQHGWDRVFALWEHVPAGQQIAREGAARSQIGRLLKPLEVIANERNADRILGSKSHETREGRHRRALIGLADKQARELRRRMFDAIEQSEAA